MAKSETTGAGAETAPVAEADEAVEALGISTRVTYDTTAVLFYSASVLSNSEYLQKGYTDFLDFNSNKKTYYTSVTTTTHNILSITGLIPSTEPTVTTDATVYYDQVIVPSGGVAIMMQYSGDGETAESVSTQHVHEYNVSTSELSFTFYDNSDDEEVRDRLDSTSNFYPHPYGGTYLNKTTSEIVPQFLEVSVDSSETEAMKHVYGWGEATSISSSINSRIDYLAQDIYSTIPVNSFIITKTDAPYNLSMENLQPIRPDELTGIGLAGATLQTGSSATVSAPTFTSTGMGSGGGGGY